MHYNSKSKRVLHNIIVVRYAAGKNVGNRATEDSHSLSHHHCQVSPHKGASSQCQCTDLLGSQD